MKTYDRIIKTDILFVIAFGPKPDEEKEADPPEPFEFTED